MKRVIFLCLLALGTLLASCSSNDDTNGDWSKSVQYAGAPRSGAVGFTINNETYVGLGYNLENNKFSELSDFKKFNGSSWEDVAPFPGEARFAAVAFVLNGKAYVGTGYRSGNTNAEQKRFDDFWVYDPVQNSWDSLTIQFPGDARRDAVAFALGNKGYVGTGSISKDQTTNDFYSFDGTKWERVNFGGDKRTGGVAFVVDNAAYVCLGKSSGSNYVSDMWKFDGTTWIKMRTLANATDDDFDNDYSRIPRAYAVAFLATLNGETRVYIAGGSSGATLKTCWEYTVKEDLWDEGNPLPTQASGRVQAVGFTYETANMKYGFITTGGGGLDSPGYDDTWKFTPGIEEDEKNDY